MEPHPDLQSTTHNTVHKLVFNFINIIEDIMTTEFLDKTRVDMVSVLSAGVSQDEGSHQVGCALLFLWMLWFNLLMLSARDLAKSEQVTLVCTKFGVSL